MPDGKPCASVASAMKTSCSAIWTRCGAVRKKDRSRREAASGENCMPQSNDQPMVAGFFGVAGGGSGILAGGTVPGAGAVPGAQHGTQTATLMVFCTGTHTHSRTQRLTV